MRRRSKGDRLFMHQVLKSLEADVRHRPLRSRGALRFRLQRSLHCRQDDRRTFDQYAVGNYAIEGKLARSGRRRGRKLSGNPVEHGGVDSVDRFL